MSDVDDRRHIYLNPVYADRVDDFDVWLREVLMPAVRKAAPETEVRQQTLRATEASDGIVYFAFVLEGGDPEEWYIEPLLKEAYGNDRAAAEMQAFESMLQGGQVGGTFRILQL